MYKMICPNCKGNSYSADNKFFSECPFCRVQFSGSYGLDRRREERIQHDQNISFIFMEQIFKARIMDLSKNGLSLSLRADLPFEPGGDRIDLSIENNWLRAEIVWWYKRRNELKIGLRAIESLIPVFPRFFHGQQVA